jgi:hypothetical protein
MWKPCKWFDVKPENSPLILVAENWPYCSKRTIAFMGEPGYEFKMQIALRISISESISFSICY